LSSIRSAVQNASTPSAERQQPDEPQEGRMAPGEITLLLREFHAGRREALDRLLPLVYEELRSIARQRLRRLPPQSTLTPTALVHEAYLKLAKSASDAPRDRSHFYAVAAMVMRQIAVDHARRRMAAKRGGAGAPVDLEFPVLSHAPADQVLAVHDALERLGQVDPSLVRIVELRYFAGLPIDEVASALGCSPMTVKRRWQTARALLYDQLATGE
jgi:RNA polymerase sigma factor (TIGR02999 family)